MVWPLSKTLQQFLTKLNVVLSYDSANPNELKFIFTQKPVLKCWQFLIHNCLKLKDEKTFVNLYHRILVSYKKIIIISCQATKRHGIKLTRALWSSWTQVPLCPPTLVCRKKKNSSKVFMSCILKYKLKQLIIVVAVVQSLSHVQLFCNPMNCNPPGSSVLWISQARILEWVAISFFRGSSGPRDQTQVSCIGKQILYH